MNRMIRGLFIALALVGGIGIIPVATWYGKLRFDDVYTAGNLIQASATLAAALVVAAYFQRVLQSDRKEKDLLLRHVDLISESVAEFERYKDGGAVTEIAAALKKLSVKIKSFSSLLAELNYDAAIQRDVNFDSLMRELRTLATETPYREMEELAKDSSQSSTVRDGFIRIANESRLLLDGKIQDMKMRLNRVQIKINRA